MEEYSYHDDWIGSENNNTLNWTRTLDNITIWETTSNRVKEEATMYILISSFLITLCMTGLGVNAFLLSSVCFIRRPLSPTLFISLSLSGSDMFTSLLLGLGLLFNSLLPVGLGIAPPLGTCGLLFLEALRMGGMYTTIFHLLALSLNHYLGILRPLHYQSLLPRSHLLLGVLLLWLVPPASMLTYFRLVDDDGFNTRYGTCTHRFIQKRKFRSVCSLIFVLCLILMGVVYVHIFIIVRKHQKLREMFKRTGSRHRNHPQGGSMKLAHQEAKKREKAVYTTMLIVGSVLLGWAPASLYFYLVCEDCVLPTNWTTSRTLHILISSFFNFLLILKTALNSYIYAARMSELKVAIKRMTTRLRSLSCRILGRDISDEELTVGINLDISRRDSRKSRKSFCRMQSFKEGDGLRQGNGLRQTQEATPL